MPRIRFRDWSAGLNLTSPEDEQQLNSLQRARNVGPLNKSYLKSAPPFVLRENPTQAGTLHSMTRFNNIMFAGRQPPDDARAICLIDLDTVGPLSLAFELGDAWRSWCNRAGEDDVNAVFDLEILDASLRGYIAGLGRALSDDERRALLLGVEWISLELAARFAGDALFESYFGWDPARFAGRGEHNLVRARGQWSLHQALLATRAQRAAISA